MAPSTTGMEKHLRVDHEKDQFVSGHAHISGIEGFWVFSKSSLARIRGMSPSTFYLHIFARRSPTIRVENSIFDKWWSDKNEVVSLEEFNQALTPVNPIPFPIFRDMPDWALVERITGKKCPETVSLRNLSRMTQAELKESLGLTDIQTKKLSAALMLGERLANMWR